MGKIIDFNQKMEERKNVSVTIKKNEISIYAYNGHIRINLNIPLQEKKKDSIIKRILKFLKCEKNPVYESQVVVENVLEDIIKEKILRCVRDISWNNSVDEEKLENLWKQIKGDILSSQNLQYYLVIGNPFDSKKTFTLISSNILIIKKD